MAGSQAVHMVLLLTFELVVAPTNHRRRSAIRWKEHTSAHVKVEVLANNALLENMPMCMLCIFVKNVKQENLMLLILVKVQLPIVKHAGKYLLFYLLLLLSI